MKITRKKLYILLTVLMVILVGIGIVVYLSLPSKESAYLIDCVQVNTDGSCAVEKALPKLNFRVYKLQGNVIQERTGSIVEFNNCIIIDTNDWQCTDGGSNDFSIGFTNGEFFIKGGSASYSELTAVPEQVWLKYQVISAPVSQKQQVESATQYLNGNKNPLNWPSSNQQ